MKKMPKENQVEEQFELEIERSNQTRAVVLIALLGIEGIVLLLIYMLFSDQYLSLFQSTLSIYAVLIFMVVIIAHELITHFFIKKRLHFIGIRRKGSAYLKAFTEVTLLSLLLVVIIFTSKQSVILHSPAVLTYFIFIHSVNPQDRLPVAGIHGSCSRGRIPDDICLVFY